MLNLELPLDPLFNQRGGLGGVRLFQRFFNLRQNAIYILQDIKVAEPDSFDAHETHVIFSRLIVFAAGIGIMLTAVKLDN